MANAMDLVPGLDLEGYISALAARQAHARAWSLFQDDHPLVLGPVVTNLPPVAGCDVESIEGTERWLTSMRLTVIGNGLGLPAAAVPAGMAGNLPTGVQVVGARYREDLSLDAAQAIEERLAVHTPINPR